MTEELERYAAIINPKDNVATALKDFQAGAYTLNGKEIKIVQDVPKGFKIAIVKIRFDEEVIKYGYPIGKAKTHIKEGEIVHVENLKSSV